MTNYRQSLYDKAQDLKRQRQSRARVFERWQDVAYGKVFSIGGSVDISFKPGYVWVHEWGMAHSPAQAFKGMIIVKEGDWVKMKKHPKDPHLWQIIDYWTGGQEPGNYAQVIRHLVALHGQNHYYPSETDPGIDKVLVWPPAWQPFKTTGDGTTLTITVQRGWYFYSNRFKIFNGRTLDLTTHIPAAGLVRRVLVYVIKATKELGTVDGATVPSVGAIPIPYPDAPADSIPSAYVTLTNGQTFITTATDVVDARDMHSFDGGAGGVSTFLDLTDVDPATYVGQAGKLVAVNATPDGLEFITAPTGGPAGSGTDNNIVRWDGTADIQDSTVSIADAGSIIQVVQDAVTSTVASVFDFIKRTTGTAAAGFGAKLRMLLEDAVGTDRTALEIEANWQDASNQDAQVVLRFLQNGVLTEAIVITADSFSASPDGNPRGEGSFDLQAARESAAHVAGGIYSALLGGWGNQISSDGVNAAIIGGNQNNNQGYNSVIVGGERVQTDKTGEFAFGGTGFTLSGDCQGSIIFCRRVIATHTDTIWFTLYLDGSSELLTVPNNGLWGVDIRILGLTSGATQRWDYSITGVSIINDGGTTTILSAGTVTANAESDAAYEVQVVADDTNDALLVQVRRNGGSNFNVQWIAQANITQARRV